MSLRVLSSARPLRHLSRTHPFAITTTTHHRHVTTETPLTTTTGDTSSNHSDARKLPTTVVQKVARATATGSYFIVVSAGIALLGVVLWALGSNLFFETRYLNEAVSMVKADRDIKK